MKGLLVGVTVWLALVAAVVAAPRPGGYLYVSLEQLDAETAAGNTPVFVDVRRPPAYEMARIPGSINVQPFALTTRFFLKSRTVVLVDRGWGNCVIERKCRRMQEDGFRSVRILRGGLNAWLTAGRPLTGTDVPGSGLTRITPLEYISVRDSGNWRAAGSREPAVAAAALPGGQQPGAPALVLVCSQEEHLRALSAAGTGAVVFHLEGGQEGLEIEEARLRAMRNPRIEKTRRPAGGSSNGAVIKKPCTACQ